MTQKYQVKVSMKQAAIVETGIVLKQGDFGMQLEIEVLDFDATGTTPQIVFRKAMGAVESTTITVSNNKYTYTFKGTELDTPGKVFCDLKLKNSTTQRISTASFMFKVVADTLDGLAEESSSYSDTIAQIVGGFDGAIEDLKTSISDIELKKLPVTLIPNQYVSASDGSIQNYNGWSRTDYMPVKEYATISVKSSASSVYNAFYDENKQKVAGFSVPTTWNTIPVPADAVYVIMSNTNAGMAALETSFTTKEQARQDISEQEIEKIKTDIPVLLNLENTENLFDVLSVAHGKALSNGNIVDGPTWNTSDFIPVTPDDVALFYATGFSNYTTGYRVFFDFYQSDKTWISHTEPQNQTTYYDCFYKAKAMTVPSNAAYLRVQYSATVTDNMGIMLSINETATEYIPFQELTAYPINKHEQALSNLSESDLTNGQKSINLLDERKKLKNCVMSNRSFLPTKWSYDSSNSSYCVFKNKLYLDPNVLYRCCVFAPPSGVNSFNIVVYAFDENDVYLASGNIGAIYSDTDHNIIFKRFKIWDWSVLQVTADHYRIQISSTVQDCKIQLVKESEYTVYYHPFNELPYAQEGSIKEYIDDKVNNPTNVGSTLVPIPQKYISGVTAPLDEMTAMCNGIDFDYVTGEERCKLFDWFSHDSSIVIVNGKIYCAYVGNKVDTGDSPTFPDAYTLLAVVDTVGFGTSSVVTNYDVAKKDDAVGAKTIISGVGVPNIVDMGNGTVRVFFSAKLSDGIYYMMYRDFDTSNNTFGSVTICQLSIDGSTYDFSTPNIHTYIQEMTSTDYFISMNAIFGKNNGDYYCGMCVGDMIPNSVILTSTDLETFSVWLKPEFSGNCHCTFEGACYCLNGYLYYALRQENTEPVASDRKMLLAKISLLDKVIADQCYFTDALSRACWYYDGTDLYLIHNTIYRKRIEFIKIDTYNLINSNIVSIAGDHMVYPWIFKNGDYLYFSATGASSTHVYLRRSQTFKRYTCKDIESKIASALRLNDVWA